MTVMDQALGQSWALYQGDSAEVLQGIGSETVDLAVFSPPFSHLFTYSASERDLGNSRTREEFFEHFGFITDELMRVMKPGRNVCVHVQQLTTTKATHGIIGMTDFRGEVIRHFQEHAFIYHGEACIDKDPQAQAIRTHSKSLLFVQLRKDSSWLRPALADYLLLFRKPGENAVPIHPDITNNEWIEWARPIWYGIKETDTLNVAEARSDRDERHICPLQRGTIERCVRLWSNPGETVLSPFAGIGSEGVVSLELGRRFLGIELKPEYFAVAAKNLRRAEQQSNAPTLFSALEDEEEEENAVARCVRCGRAVTVSSDGTTAVCSWCDVSHEERIKRPGVVRVPILDEDARQAEAALYTPRMDEEETP